MGSGGGGGNPANTTNEQTMRYAPYIESHHSTFLDMVASYRGSTIGASPFGVFSDILISDAFFGTGFIISNFPSLYDMYGKFMAGLDIEALYTEILDDSVNNPTINNLVSAEAALLDDEIKTTSLPQLQTGMRDINSVMSSSFVVGKSLIEDARIKSISKFSAELKYRMLSAAADRWRSHLDWNKSVVSIYADIMKLYYAVVTDVNEFNYSMKSRHLLWPFTVLEFNRAALGALQGAVNSRTETAGASGRASILSGMFSGASAGAMMGGMFGSPLIGGGAGAILGLAGAFL